MSSNRWCCECKSFEKDVPKELNIHFYSFPASSVKRNQWRKALEIDPNTTIPNFFAVCSKHFLISDFKIESHGIILNPDAIPMNFRKMELLLSKNVPSGPQQHLPDGAPVATTSLMPIMKSPFPGVPQLVKISTISDLKIGSASTMGLSFNISPSALNHDMLQGSSLLNIGTLLSSMAQNLVVIPPTQSTMVSKPSQVNKITDTSINKLPNRVERSRNKVQPYKSRKKFVGDFDESDFETSNEKQAFIILKNTMSKLRRSKRTLQMSSARLKTRFTKLNAHLNILGKQCDIAGLSDQVLNGSNNIAANMDNFLKENSNRETPQSGDSSENKQVGLDDTTNKDTIPTDENTLENDVDVLRDQVDKEIEGDDLESKVQVTVSEGHDTIKEDMLRRKLKQLAENNGTKTKKIRELSRLIQRKKSIISEMKREIALFGAHEF